jgi:hypothetical protein
MFSNLSCTAGALQGKPPTKECNAIRLSAPRSVRRPPAGNQTKHDSDWIHLPRQPFWLPVRAVLLLALCLSCAPLVLVCCCCLPCVALVCFPCAGVLLLPALCCPCVLPLCWFAVVACLVSVLCFPCAVLVLFLCLCCAPLVLVIPFCEFFCRKFCRCGRMIGGQCFKRSGDEQGVQGCTSPVRAYSGLAREEDEI